MTTIEYPVVVHMGSSVEVPTLPPEYRRESLDVTILTYQKMTISDARDFISLARERPLEKSLRTLVLCTPRLSEAVQNTLLKILEEPPLSTRIHIILPHVGHLLSTVRSRVQVVGVRTVSTELSAPVTDWLAATPAERIQTIANWHKKADTDYGAELLPAIGEWLHTHVNSVSPELLQVYQLVDTWYQQSGASRKMLLEELALQLPVID